MDRRRFVQIAGQLERFREELEMQRKAFTTNYDSTMFRTTISLMSSTASLLCEWYEATQPAFEVKKGNIVKEWGADELPG